MRIALCNWSGRKAGGAEEFVEQLAEALSRRGHDLGLVFETDAPHERVRIAMPADSPTFQIGRHERAAGLAALRTWKPDVIYCCNFHDTTLEKDIAQIAPALFDAHTYNGTCISGTKCHMAPLPAPCTKPLGPSCLLYYFPRRCGGLNPLTMLRQYGVQRRRGRALRLFSGIVTHSEHMRREFVRNGFAHSRVVNLTTRFSGETYPAIGSPPAPVAELSTYLNATDEERLIFVGRMHPQKGGLVLLDALSRVHSSLGRRLSVVFVGDGNARHIWEARAKQVMSQVRGVTITFAGWLRDRELAEAYASARLLVVPSLWPEPYALVGEEAARHGVPAVAFTVGGIPEWLCDGVNGHLAGPEPRPDALADAIVACLVDDAHYARLVSGARELVRHSAQGKAIKTLVELLERCGNQSRPAALGT